MSAKCHERTCGVLLRAGSLAHKARVRCAATCYEVVCLRLSISPQIRRMITAPKMAPMKPAP
jgi:hypothetical protein